MSTTIEGARNKSVTLVELDDGVQWLMLTVGNEVVYFVDPRYQKEFNKEIGPLLL